MSLLRCTVCRDRKNPLRLFSQYCGWCASSVYTLNMPQPRATRDVGRWL